MGLTYEEVQARVQAGGGSDDPENPKYLRGSKDRKMRQTLRNINEGVPADPLTWNGKPMEAGTGALLEESAGTAAPKPMSFEEVQARLGAAPTTSGAQAWLKQGGEVVKSTLTNLAGIADMVLSVPGMVLSSGADLGTRINEFADPLLRGYEGASRKEVGQKALAAGQSLAEPFMNPLHKLMKAFGYGEAYDASDVQQAMGMISKGIQSGGDWVEKQTKGLLTTEDVQSLANAAMAGAGAWGTAKGVQPKVDAIGKAKPTDLPGAARTAEAAKKLREEDYASPQDFTADVERSAQGEALNTIDAMRNAEQRAYDLMQGEAWKEQGGVPKKQVEAIRKHNPLVGEALDRAMERRRLAIEGFKETLQGEWLPPEEPAAAMATPRGPGITAPSGVPGLKELPTLDQRLLEDLSSRFKDDLQSGQADPRLLAVLAATGLTAAAFMQLDPKDREDAKVLGLAAMMLPAGKGVTSASRLFSRVKELAPVGYKARSRLVELPIEDFLRLAPEGTDSFKTRRIDSLANTETAFSEVPALHYELGEAGARVVGHEGRHRARKLLELGYTTMPVELRGPIRWSEQSNPDSFDYVQRWPETLQGDRTTVRFPLSREQAGVDYSEQTGQNTATVTELLTKPIRDFHKSLGKSVRARMEDTARKVEAYDGWQWSIGDRVRSNTSGKVYEITGKTWDYRKDEPMYRYEAAVPKDQEGYEAGSFRAGVAHESLTKLTGPRKLENGSADPRLLAALAAAGISATAYFALSPEEQKGVKHLALAAGLLPVGGGLSSLSTALRKAGNYSSTILERLPQDRHTFTKKQVWEQVARADVSQAEKDAFKYILRNKRGQEITAQELVDGFYQDTADLRLERVEHQERRSQHGTRLLAEWGLDRIDRQALDENGIELPVPSATSTIYRLPYKVSTNNHFGDPKYYGHTRSFIDELGERRVIEVQNDLLQKLRKLSAEELAEDKASYAQAQADIVMLRNLQSAASSRHGRPLTDVDVYKVLPPRLLPFYDSARSINQYSVPTAIAAVDQHVTLRMRELSARMQPPPDSTRFGPITKYWPQRLIREELARAAQEGQKTEHFATADTVAKVEGWPDAQLPAREALARAKQRVADVTDGKVTLEGVDKDSLLAAAESQVKFYQEKLEQAQATPRFKPEHQSIYDRYLKDIEPYLKKLGGVETKDSAGHTWISVPVKPEHGRVPIFGQAGQIDPRLLARMAAVGLGVTLGMWASDRDHKWTGAALGAMVGFGLGRSPAKLVQTWKGLWAKDTRFRIDDLTNAWEFAQDKAAKLAWDLQRSVEKLVPEDAGRVRITQWLDDPSSIQLRGAELRAAQMVKAWFDGMKVAATNAGVLKTAVDNYVTHLWDWKAGRAQSPILQAFYDRLEGRGAGMSPHSPYAKERTFSTLEEGKRAGLTPLTEDISAIIGIYSNSMSRAMANKALLDGLKKGKMPNGMGLVIPADKAPHYYARVDSPQMAGVAVHPDIAPSLNFLFSKAPRGALPAALEMVNTAIKRSQVSFSLFHVKALIDAGLAGTSHPLDFIAKLPEYFSGRTDLLKQLRQQGLTPMIELAYKSGLKFGLEKGKLAVEDVGMDSFYAGLKSLQVGLDSAFKGLGKPVEGLAKVNHAFDKFMWDWVHTGMKLDVFAEKVEALTESSVQRHAKDPNIPVLTKEQAGAIAASYTNDLLGGLNWRRIAEGAQTKWGRNLALQIYSKQGRWWMQLALFAPDWTLSTTRAMAQAFGKGSGPIKGLLKPTTLADLHRQYIARAAAIYFVVGNTLNQAISGKWLWENEDWTTIDMGDGRKLQWSKHTMEPVHWVQKPGQQGLNKMGILPKEGLEQLLGVEYLSTKGNMRPMEGDRLAHAAKKLLPISVASSFDAGAEAGLLGFAGIPIHGRSYTQRANDRLRRRLEKLDRLGEE